MLVNCQSDIMNVQWGGQLRLRVLLLLSFQRKMAAPDMAIVSNSAFKFSPSPSPSPLFAANCACRTARMPGSQEHYVHCIPAGSWRGAIKISVGTGTPHGNSLLYTLNILFTMSAIFEFHSMSLELAGQGCCSSMMKMRQKIYLQTMELI